MKSININDDEYEAGGSIIHEKNLYMKRFADELGKISRSLNNQVMKAIERILKWMLDIFLIFSMLIDLCSDEKE